MRCYRCLMGIFFPASFRARFAEDMAEVFADRLRAARAASVVAVATLWVRTIVDLAGQGTAERWRSQRQPPAMRPMFASDLRFALRFLRGRPGFTATALLTLGLGIGAATAVFTVTNALLLRAMPYQDADRLVRLFERQDEEGFSGNVAPGNVDDWCSAPGFESCGAYFPSDLNLAGAFTPDRVSAAVTTHGVLPALGVRPLAGRLLGPADLATPVVLATETLSRRLFGTTGTVGRTLSLDGVAHEIVGVIPDIPGLDTIALWRPLPAHDRSRQNHSYRGLAKLRASETTISVQAQLEAISRTLQRLHPDTNAHWWASIAPLQASLTTGLPATLRLLGVLVAVLLLLCSLNVAGLVGGQAAARRQELAVRLALGADRRRLLRQLVVESALLAAGGAAVGLAVAHWTAGAVMAALPPTLVPWRLPAIDASALAFATLVACGTSLIFGVAPAIGLSRHASAMSALRAQNTVMRRHGGRALLAAVQAGLATVLLVTAALLGSALVQLLLVDPGFRASGVLTFRVTPARSTYADAASVTTFFEALSDRLGRLPAVETVSAASSLPLDGPNVVRGVIRPGEPMPPPRKTRLTLFTVTTPGFFRALGIPLLEGRDFDSTDTETGQPVAIVNQDLAARLWPGQRAVGREILVHTDEETPRLVVGVAANIRQTGLDDQVTPQYYVPLSQSPRRTLRFVVHTRGPLTRDTLQTEVAALDRALPLYDLAPLDALVAQSTADRRVITATATMFGVVAVLLAAIGLYGLAAARVAERTREIGVRVALGASRPAVLRLVTGRGLLATAAGVIAGLAGSVPARTLLANFLTGVPTSNAGAMAIAAAVLIAVAAMASWIPARRALAIDPVQALRE